MAKISVNQLAKYLVASPTQRRSIVVKQIEQKPFIVNYYDQASKAIQKYFLAPSRDEEILVQTVDAIFKMTPKDENEETKFDNNIGAINSFLGCIDEIRIMENSTISEVPNTCPKVTVNGVEISVYPNCVFTGQYNNKNVVGAIKLYFGKNDPLTQNMGGYITALMRRFLEENNNKDGAVNNKMCQVIDVFGHSVFFAPDAYVSRMKDVAIACEEIKFWWDHITQAAQG